MTGLRTTDRLSLGLSLAFLLLLAVLHVLEPEFNTGHLISHYQLGDYGLLMSLAFCLLGGSALSLAIGLKPRLLDTTGARAGRTGLVGVGVAFFVAGIFPPVQAPAIVGYLHGVAGLYVILGAPIVFTCICGGLADLQTRRRVRLATVLAWLGLCCFVASLVVFHATGQTDVPMHPSQSIANRFLIVTYCIWLMSAAWK